MEGTNYFICLRRICNPDKSRIKCLGFEFKNDSAFNILHALWSFLHEVCCKKYYGLYGTCRYKSEKQISQSFFSSAIKHCTYYIESHYYQSLDQRLIIMGADDQALKYLNTFLFSSLLKKYDFLWVVVVYYYSITQALLLQSRAPNQPVHPVHCLFFSLEASKYTKIPGPLKASKSQNTLKFLASKPRALPVFSLDWRP